MQKRLLTLFFFISFLIPLNVLAWAPIGGVLTYKYLGNKNYEVTLTKYTICNTTSQPCQCPGLVCSQQTINIYGINGTYINNFVLTIDPNSGTATDIVELCPGANSVCINCGNKVSGSFSPGYETYVFKGIWSAGELPIGYCTVELGFVECCRSENFINLNNSVNNYYYISTQINTCLNDVSSFEIKNKPMIIACNGREYVYNPGIFLDNSDSLLFSVGTSSVAHLSSYTYKTPYNNTNYPLNYNGAPTATLPRPFGFHLNPQNGDITFTPNGTYVASFNLQTQSWRRDTLSGVKTMVGMIDQDYEINSINCPTDENPVNLVYMPNGQIDGTLTNVANYNLPSKIDICPYDTFCRIFVARDGYVSNDVEDTTFINFSLSSILMDPNYGSYSINYLYNTTTRAINGPKYDSVKFCWTPSLLAVNTFKNKPLFFTVNSKDLSCPIPGKAVQSIALYIRPNQTNVNPIFSDSVFSCFNNVVIITNSTIKNCIWNNGNVGNVLTASESGIYMVKGNLSSGCPISDQIVVNINKSHIKITKNLSNVLVKLDSFINFKVEKESSLKVTYQWFKNNKELIGQTDSILKLNPLGFNDEAYYKVKLMTSCDTLMSDSAKISLHYITLNSIAPVYQICKSKLDTFQLSYQSNASVQIKWYKNNQFVSNNLLILSGINSDTGAFYYAKLFTDLDTLISNSFKIKYQEPLLFSYIPNSNYHLLHELVGLNVDFNGDDSCWVSWFLNNKLTYKSHLRSYLINDFTYKDSGLYVIQVNSKCYTSSSSAFRLSLQYLELINTFKDTNICYGSDVNVSSFVKTNTSGLVFKWNHNGNMINYNSKNLLINKFSEADTGFYILYATNSFQTIISDTMYLHLRNLPPVKIKITPNPICYQSNTYIKGSGAKQFDCFPDSIMQRTDSCSFICTPHVTQLIRIKGVDQFGCVNRDSSWIVVNHLPIYSIEPKSQYCLLGDSICFNGKILLDTMGLNFEWYLNGQLLPVNNDIVLPIPHVQTTDTGLYVLRSANLCGSVFSQAAFLRFHYQNLLQSPKIPNTRICENNDYQINISAQSSSNLTYQWYKNNQAIVGQTDSFLRINNIQKSDTCYFCVIHGKLGDMISDTICMNINESPHIINQPKSININTGQSVNFSVSELHNTSNFAWQHKLGSVFVNLQNDNNYSGVFTNQLNIQNVGKSLNNQWYRCKVTYNDCNANSDSVLLTVITTGILEIDNYKFSIHPNPSNDKIIITCDNYIHPFELELFNLEGVSLKTIQINQVNSELDIQDLAAGLYFVSNNKSKKTYKLIKY